MDYYYLNTSNEPVGPMALSAIESLAAAGVISGNSLVCRSGEEEWNELPRALEASSPTFKAGPPRTTPPLRAKSLGGNSPREDSHQPGRFPFASLISGIVALLLLSFPVLSMLLAAFAVSMGILALKRNATRFGSLTVIGILTSSLAVVLIVSSSIAGNSGSRYVGSWQTDLSVSFGTVQMGQKLIITFYEDGTFIETERIHMGGVNESTGQAGALGNSFGHSGYWHWDRTEEALVTRLDDKSIAVAMDGRDSAGREIDIGPFFDPAPSASEGEMSWIFRPDPKDDDVLIGEHPTLYHHRIMRFVRL